MSDPVVRYNDVVDVLNDVIWEVKRLREFAEKWKDLHRPFPREEWHKDDGDVLWWRFPVTEPPYVGSPLDGGDDFPDYVTHWTRCPVPTTPAAEPDEYGLYHDRAVPPAKERLLEATPVRGGEVTED